MEIYSYTNAFDVDAEPVRWSCSLGDQKLANLVYLLAQHQEYSAENPGVCRQMVLLCVCVCECICAFLCQKPLGTICSPPCSVSQGAYHLHIASTALTSKALQSDELVCAAHVNERESLTCTSLTCLTCMLFISRQSPLAQTNSCCITRGLSDGPVVFYSLRFNVQDMRSSIDLYGS